MRRPVAVDLFAGVGGMSLGFEQAGFDVVCAVESDVAHAAAHRFNFPLCEVLQEDARFLTAQRLHDAVVAGLRRHGRRPGTGVDVVFGGPPCQGFSVGGRLDPEDPRNRLVAEFARLVAELRPNAWVIENVPAMATRSLPGDEPMPVIDWLAAQTEPHGYSIADAAVLNANRFGVPQDRRRLLVVGVRDGVRFQMPEPVTAGLGRVPTRGVRPGEFGHPRTPTGLDSCPTVAEAVGDLPDHDRFERLLTDDTVSLRPEDLARSQMSRYARRLAGIDVDPTDYAWKRQHDPTLLTASMRTVHSATVIARFAETRQGEREVVSRFLRLHPDGVAPTLRAGTAPDRGSYSAPRPIHHEHNRVISVREAARLHGYPDWFRPSVAKWHGFRQVGNSVPPPLAKAVASRLRDALSRDAARPEGCLPAAPPELLRVPAGGGRAAAKRRMLETMRAAPAA